VIRILWVYVVLVGQRTVLVCCGFWVWVRALVLWICRFVIIGDLGVFFCSLIFRVVIVGLVLLF